VIAVNLVPWPVLTRTGIPAFLVARRPLCVEGREYPVGVEIPPALIPSRVRLRQLYEQRRLEPVEAHKRSVRALNEARVKVPAAPVELLNVGVYDQSGFESLDLPAADVTELEEQPLSKKEFQPRRAARRSRN
jgi:hypothetical protein